MPRVCLFCDSVYFPSLHRTECPDCGYWFSDDVFAEGGS